MSLLRRHGLRIAVTLVPVMLAMLHASGTWRAPFVDRLDHFIYDARLRATMPRSLDPRIVIVAIDDASLQQFGQWPWSRDKLARLTSEITTRQSAAVLGFDVLFVEPDASSGLPVLQQLAIGALRHRPDFAAEVERLGPELDRDATFARALAARPVALGYYFTQSTQPRTTGRLPQPVLRPDMFVEGSAPAQGWNGFGASIAPLAEAAPAAGFLNVVLDAQADGVVRSVPLLGRYQGSGAEAGYYESLSLVVHRLAVGSASLVPTFAPAGAWGGRPVLESLRIGTGTGLSFGSGSGSNPGSVRVPVDAHANVLVPFRGRGGAQGGSFRYVSAADVLRGALPPDALKGKIVLVGATAPGLQDLRTTPVDVAFPGVEVHANIISGLLDRRFVGVPDYATGFDLVVLFLAGCVLAFGLSLLPAVRALLLAASVGALLVGLNFWLHLQAGLVLPLAAALLTTAMAFVVNTSWGYFVEARASRNLAALFSTYVPRQLVDEMRRDPQRYSMRAESKELTVMFCDMRGFTRLSEQMAPVELQAFLNGVFSRLTEIISRRRGTVDKYMGDCVMAFWGAPVDMPDHGALAVEAALDMAAAVGEINQAHAAAGRPAISVGIGLNSGVMSVGDMGSAVRRSYTVVGDAVNLASRLEGLSGIYGVEIVASAATRDAAPGFVWQELDLVRVKGKAQAVHIFTPVARTGDADAPSAETRDRWDQVLAAYRRQDWEEGQIQLAPLLATDVEKVLYQLYAQRLASTALQPRTPDWDGATRFDTK